MCIVLLSEDTAVIFLHRIKGFVFITGRSVFIARYELNLYICSMLRSLEG